MKYKVLKDIRSLTKGMIIEPYPNNGNEYPPEYFEEIKEIKRLPLTMQDIIEKYLNGWIRNNGEKSSFITKINTINKNSVFISLSEISYEELMYEWEISLDGKVWDKCWK